LDEQLAGAVAGLEALLLDPFTGDKAAELARRVISFAPLEAALPGTYRC
jgi:hypothetical protein